MTQQTIERLLVEFKKLNDTIPNLNCGGCGVFAENLFRFLERMGYSPSLIVLTYDEGAWVNAIESNDYNTNPICHVVIKVKGWYIDSNHAFRDMKDFQMASGWYHRKPVPGGSIDTLREWNKNGNWNHLFDRSHIPQIETFFNNLTI